MFAGRQTVWFRVRTPTRMPAILITTAVLAAGQARGDEGQAGDPAAWFRDEIHPILVNSCYDCHGDGLRRGELALDDFPDIPSKIENRDVWQRIREHIDFRLMPPPDEPPLTDAERGRLLAWIDAAVFPTDPENPDPGHVTLRRLNRNEYENTVRDLLGIRARLAEILPADDSGYGFDNIGDVLTLSPLHLERYIEAARIAVEAALHPDPMPPRSDAATGRRLRGPGQSRDDGHSLYINGTASATFRVDSAGDFRIRARLSGTPGDHVEPAFVLLLGDDELLAGETSAREIDPEEITHDLRLDAAGEIRIGVRFTNDAWFPDHPDAAQRDRNLFVHSIVLDGPLDAPPPQKPATHRAVFIEREDGEADDAYMERVLARLARRAFRRPTRDGEIRRYLHFLSVIDRDAGETVEHAVAMAMQAMLASPSFLFREEPAELAPGADIADARIVPISEHALASRLSYFLWSTMPDERLLDLADAGKLRDNIDAEIARMIGSRNSDAFVRNFAGQWLQLRNLDAVSFSGRDFPTFNHRLASSMRRETELLFTHILRENLPVHTLLDADFTFVDARLAGHYGFSGVDGDDFRRVDLEGTPRRGILNHASILTLTSYPTRTSPVIRGQFVLENILNTPAPPPPPNVPQLDPPRRRGEQPSLREQLERHRDDPSCASCHALMDPIGFGLENYDPLGRWRDADRGQPIDPSGKLANGATFATAEELRDLIARGHREEFHRALATKLLTYALGRGTQWFDRPAIDGIVARSATDDARFQALVSAIVHSTPFQYRRNQQE